MENIMAFWMHCGTRNGKKTKLSALQTIKQHLTGKETAIFKRITLAGPSTIVDVLSKCSWGLPAIHHFVFGWYFMLHGCKEIAKLEWEQTKFREFESSKDQGKNKVQVDIDWDKVHQLPLTKTVVHSKDNKARLHSHENPDNILCPFILLAFFQTLCHPEQERVLCRVASMEQKWKL